jgi:hypothetical protein
MEVSNQLQAPTALSPGKDPPGILGGGVCPIVGLDAVVKNYQPLTGLEPPIIHAITTDPSRGTSLVLGRYEFVVCYFAVWEIK